MSQQRKELIKLLIEKRTEVGIKIKELQKERKKLSSHIGQVRYKMRKSKCIN